MIRHVTLSIQDDEGKPLVSMGKQLRLERSPVGGWFAYEDKKRAWGYTENGAIMAAIVRDLP